MLLLDHENSTLKDQAVTNHPQHQERERESANQLLPTIWEHKPRFPLWLLLVVASPFLWVSWDMAVSHHAIGNLEDASFWFIASVGYWLGAVPTCLAWAFYVPQLLSTFFFGVCARLGLPVETVCVYPRAISIWTCH